jgi:hypothetical protein
MLIFMPVYKDRQITVVIPCLNEEEGIVEVLKCMPPIVDEVIVVDNGSTDRTAELASYHGARVIHEKVRGYGRAYKTGLLQAQGDIIVTLDGDHSYPPDAISYLLEALHRSHVRFLSASRFPLRNKEAMSFKHRVGNKLLSLAMSFLYFRWVRDSQSGMWVFERDSLREMDLVSDGMAFSEEIKIEAILKPQIGFKEIYIDYSNRMGEVKLQPWRDGLRNLSFLIRKRFDRLITADRTPASVEHPKRQGCMRPRKRLTPGSAEDGKTARATDFDTCADNYDSLLAVGLSITGEDKKYYARGRLVLLGRRLKMLHETPTTVMDFGCGTGSGVPFILEQFGSARIIGIDVSPKSLQIARSQYGSQRVEFALWDAGATDQKIDLVFCNGVFHHIPPNERDLVVRYVYRVLRPGGLLALWENNPWNPGTRYIMSISPLDKDANMMSPHKTKRLLRSHGFKIVSTDFLFIFPRVLRRLRPIEPMVVKLPVGGQYQVLVRKPDERPSILGTQTSYPHERSQMRGYQNHTPVVKTVRPATDEDPE